MNTGMLWFDNDPKTTLDAKIKQAAEYYQHKYGHTPDLCIVNPGSLPTSGPQTEPRMSGRILVRAQRTVLPNHIWIGVDEHLPAAAD